MLQVPDELFKQGEDAVLPYARKLVSEGAKVQKRHKVKVVLLGEGGVGKTTLVQALVQGTFRACTACAAVAMCDAELMFVRCSA